MRGRERGCFFKKSLQIIYTSYTSYTYVCVRARACACDEYLARVVFVLLFNLKSD